MVGVCGARGGDRWGCEVHTGLHLPIILSLSLANGAYRPPSVFQSMPSTFPDHDIAKQRTTMQHQHSLLLFFFVF